jgi:hypothetical protein
MQKSRPGKSGRGFFYPAIIRAIIPHPDRSIKNHLLISSTHQKFLYRPNFYL